MTTSTPAFIEERVQRLAAECGVVLRVTRSWKSEFHPGWYCRFHGSIHRSGLLSVEVAGSLAVELVEGCEDEVDLFLFVNGVRVGRLDAPYQYLHRRGSEAFRWDDLDEAFEVQKTVSSITMDGA